LVFLAEKLFVKNDKGYNFKNSARFGFSIEVTSIAVTPEP